MSKKGDGWSIAGWFAKPWHGRPSGSEGGDFGFDPELLRELSEEEREMVEESYQELFGKRSQEGGEGSKIIDAKDRFGGQERE